MADFGMTLPQPALGNIGIDIGAINAQNASTLANMAQSREMNQRTRILRQQEQQTRAKAEQEIYDKKAIQGALKAHTDADGEIDWGSAHKTLQSIPDVSPSIIQDFGSKAELMKYYSGLPDDSAEKYYGVAAAISNNWDLMKTIYEKTHASTSSLGKQAGWEYKRDLVNEISAMPEGPDKEARKNEYMTVFNVSKSPWATEQEIYRQEKLRPGQVQTSAEQAAASAAARINTESNLADVSGKTAGKISGEKAKGERAAGLTLSETASERLGDFDASVAQLSTLSKSYSNPNAPQGPISQLRKVNPYDWEAQAKQQLIAATKQTVGKALEGGVLRAEDEVKYNKILPTMGDTYQAAIQKTKNIKEMLNNARTAKLNTLKSAGYDVSKFDSVQTKIMFGATYKKVNGGWQKQ
jgi:hypothetical protein